MDPRARSMRLGKKRVADYHAPPNRVNDSGVSARFFRLAADRKDRASLSRWFHSRRSRHPTSGPKGPASICVNRLRPRSIPRGFSKKRARAPKLLDLDHENTLGDLGCVIKVCFKRESDVSRSAVLSIAACVSVPDIFSLRHRGATKTAGAAARERKEEARGESRSARGARAVVRNNRDS